MSAWRRRFDGGLPGVVGLRGAGIIGD
jgi:hypothetical protein